MEHYCIYRVNKVTKEFTYIADFECYAWAFEFMYFMNKSLEEDPYFQFDLRKLDSNEFRNRHRYSPFLNEVVSKKSKIAVEL